MLPKNEMVSYGLFKFHRLQMTSLLIISLLSEGQGSFFDECHHFALLWGKKEKKAVHRQGRLEQ